MKSLVDYPTGTKLKDEKTKEVFKVLKSERISLFGRVRYGLTLKQLKSEG